MTVFSRTTLASIFVFAALIGSAAPLAARAATFEVSGWIPYWAVAKGTQQAKSNLDKITELNPFVYTLRTDGTVKDNGKLSQKSWKRLFTAAEGKGVHVVPTVMTSDGALVHTLLSDPSTRKAHVEYLGELVRENDFGGIDIDYEGKKAETREYFATFLKELKAELGDDLILSCTLEARTPPDSLYKEVPATLEYANDYPSINKYCDRVKLMTYDQQRADIKLNADAVGPYAPLSDIRWVEKVVKLAKKSIDADKIMIGIPTYGHEYEVTVSPNGYTTYKKLWAFNPKYAEDIVKKKKLSTYRTGGSELATTYFDKKPKESVKGVDAPSGTPKGMMTHYEAKKRAADSGTAVTYRLMTWSDEVAIKSKADLARSEGVMGVAVFKFDGATDKDLFKVLP